jgi:hypothetical protein
MAIYAKTLSMIMIISSMKRPRFLAVRNEKFIVWASERVAVN